MTTVALRVYRWLVRLYPKRFRDEYGADLVGLLGDQLRDEPGWRVLTRAAVDLVLTVPTQHLRARMDRSPNPAVPGLFAAVAFAAVVVGAVVGHPAVLLVCLAVAVAAGGLALLAVHRARPLTEARPRSAQWWKLTGAGAGLLAALVVVTTATGELPDGGWYIAMLTGLTAIVLLGAGLALGVIHLVGRGARRAAT